MEWDKILKKINPQISLFDEKLRTINEWPEWGQYEGNPCFEENELNQTFIYFISSQNQIKIGYSNNPIKRLKNMQVGNPNELVLLLFYEGSIYEEQELHTKFSEYHVRGEWFRYSREIQNYIDEKRK